MNKENDMELTIRKAMTEDFSRVFALFHQLWPNKELNENELDISIRKVDYCFDNTY